MGLLSSDDNPTGGQCHVNGRKGNEGVVWCHVIRYNRVEKQNIK